MSRIILFVFFLLVPLFVDGQIQRPSREKSPTTLTTGDNNRTDNSHMDQRSVISKKEKPPISEYRLISVQRDTAVVDTSLTIYKDYIFNYLRRDNFELLPFSNVGQAYNSLSFNFNEDYSLIPQFGARAKHSNYFEVEDINYYLVPTPLSELYYKTAFEQGQQLDAFFTVNVKPNINFSIAYKGLRSLGRYRNIRSNSGNFRFTINYNTLNNRYEAKTHFVSQEIRNQENGGLQPLAVQQYIDEVEEFDDRTLLEVNFEDAENALLGKRFYLNHLFNIGNIDTTAVNHFQVGHILNFTHKKYEFTQSSPYNEFGGSFQQTGLGDAVRLDNLYNEAYVKFTNRGLGDLILKGALTNYNYGYNAVVNFESQHITNRLIGDVVSAGADYSNRFYGFELNLKTMLNVAGEMDGYLTAANLSYRLNDRNAASVEIASNSRQPDFNFLLYQSDYINYNWQNNFKNEKINSLSFTLSSLDLAKVEASYSQINDYTYFALNSDSLVNPVQSNEQVDFLKLKVGRNFSYGKFAIENTVLFQKVLKGDHALNVPDFVTRNTIYFQDHLFRRALFLQTGFTFKYFSDYHMNGYDPILSEFYVQNDQKLNGFPTVNFFLNTKIRQTRIFFKLEHLNAAFTGNNNFSAPAYPYRDFAIRFGLVWNFFL